MFYFTAAYHSLFYYDEVHRRSSMPSNSLTRPGQGSQLKSRMSNTPNSFKKSTGEESDASGLPVTSGINESQSRHEQEKSLQSVIHDKDPTHHDADEEPTIPEDSVFAQITEPKRSSENDDVK